MNRFFSDEAFVDGEVVLSGENFKHINNVLRMRLGEKIEVFYQGEGFLCELVQIDKSSLTVKCLEKINASNELKTRINIFQGLPKKDKMELIIQKAVELGAASVFPVNMDRSIVKYDKKKTKNKMARWEKIAYSASEQSKRDVPVSVHEPNTLKALEAELKSADISLVLYENDEDFGSFKTFLQSIEKYDTINVIIGPEGGISEGELAYLKSIGARTMSLGRRTLRTETAGLAFLSCASVFLEDNED